MLVLDTNHVRELGFKTAAGLRLLRRLEAADEETATAIVSVEEELRGWLEEINRHTEPHRQIAAYAELHHRIEFFAAWVVLPLQKEAADLFPGFRLERVRCASMDLKIACIALAHDASLLTRNTADFASVPGLRVENWLG